jgi:putative transposase
VSEAAPRKALLGPVHDQLKQIIEEVTDEHEWAIIRLTIQHDYLHRFIRANPYMVPCDNSPRLIKGCSSHDLRQEFPPLSKLASLWTRWVVLSMRAT